jgi:large subunit ribosomal protein L9
MQIILLEKVANVGNLGEVVKVKAGFARNYLIPHGKAKRATPENLKLLEEKQKAGVDGRLFGSVGTVDIVDAFKGQGITVEKAAIRMPSGPLKQVGDHPITVALHTDVTAHITVSVLGDTSQG